MHSRRSGSSRTDEILSFANEEGIEVKLLPLALETILEETPDLRRFQLIQTGVRVLSLRLDAEPGADMSSVWATAEGHLRRYLEERGLAQIAFERSSDPPRPNPGGGKLRHVWSELGARAAVAAE